ncbi:hypothetical protein P154DRAFT_518641 [Amniculicola lignicola CBS 123094]|uniref:BHLH domain-containing protein n=1 Tax=Amniculicola lignicola CBS 123094 TaxID=1392246 RepID=A0A6A5WTP3_9PLEO|nr:hypothetical protein P154DRAFT_518641 [Amniculicola lignicola CBS 123094]
MDQRGPFGYQFEPFFPPTTDVPTAGPSLLSENEGQSLVDFFTNTDPFFDDGLGLSTATAHKAGLEDSQNWDYVPPMTLHGVSTTISDQSQLHDNFNSDHTFPQHNFLANHLTNTHDDLQAASTLFNNAQAASHHTNGRAYSFHGLPTSSAATHAPTPPVPFHNMPMVPTPHGLMNEQLAALLPHHSENGSVDAAVAAQFGSIQPVPPPEFESMRQSMRPAMKRAYTYGTDNAFNSSGYVGPPVTNDSEDAIVQLLRQDLRHVPPLARHSIASVESAKASSPGFPIGLVEIPSDDDERSEHDSSPEDDSGEQPLKKRRKGKNSISIKTEKLSSRKSISGSRPQKIRKSSADELASKKKRNNSAAAAKLQRENLTEEQKRSNHILSEQKRRNLIKRGFDDLHDMVPEVRNGGLSKSSVLMEAATFLEKVIEGSNRLNRLLDSGNGG